MLYSRWIPSGGYEVFEAPGEVHGLGDDLPTPELPRPEKFGVPSTEAGRPMPLGAIYRGRSKTAVGLVAPMHRAALSGLAPTSSSAPWIAAGMVAGALLLLAVSKGGR